MLASRGSSVDSKVNSVADGKVDADSLISECPSGGGDVRQC